MNAPQDEWAGPLAAELIDEFRTKALTYVKVAFGEYDETIGAISDSETSFTAAGAVTRSRKAERNGVQQGHEMIAWIDHKTVPWPVSSADYLSYLGKKWKVTDIESYGSGGDGTVIGPIYLSTVDGRLITTLNGQAIIIQGSGGTVSEFTMYASKITARAE